MKKYLLPLLLLIASPAAAEEEITTEQWCKVVESIAELAIHQRYSGKSLSEVMEGGYHIDLYREIVLDAYSRPEWLTPESIGHESRAFVNKWTVACYEVNR